MKKYAIHPSYKVIDGLHHDYITLEQLMEMRGLKKMDYIIWERDKKGRKWEDYTHLWPIIKVSEAQYFLNLLSIGDNDE